MESLAELRARQQEIVREWQWLHDALNVIARSRAEGGEVQVFRLMQAQAMAVDQRRIELDMRIAELEGPPLHSLHGDRQASLQTVPGHWMDLREPS
jgi:hypothetical protein